MILWCKKCGRTTTELEAMARVFNTGMCQCGGNLSQKPIMTEKPVESNRTHTREGF